MFAYFTWESNFHASIKDKVKKSLQRKGMESDQDHRKESDLDYRMRVLEQVGKELNLMGKLKKDVLMEVDFFAKMIFTINQSWRESKNGNSHWEIVQSRLPKRISDEWKSHINMDMHTQMFLHILSHFNTENIVNLI